VSYFARVRHTWAVLADVRPGVLGRTPGTFVTFFGTDVRFRRRLHCLSKVEVNVVDGAIPHSVSYFVLGWESLVATASRRPLGSSEDSA
jgi:hypothetical protein